jgi:hypothetical protein
MIDAIRTGDQEIMDLFGPGFSTALKWTNFLEQYFGPGDPLTINKVLDSGERWHSVRFQALYIACWIYHPVEKGSYMIKLTPPQKANAENSAKKLTSRWSSHLAGSSYSAGKDFAFVNGYSELLVMVYEDYLFLKMEGHSALSWAHLKAWNEKRKTAAGSMNNPALNRLATQKPELGIIARGAENYSKEYEKFLEELGLSRRTVTVSDTLLALKQKTSLPLANPVTYEQVKVFLRSVPAKLDGKLKEAFNAAKDDLRDIARDSFAKDTHRLAHDGVDDTGMDRIFRELRLDPQRIDRKLNKFVKALRAKTFEEVQSINNG